MSGRARTLGGTSLSRREREELEPYPDDVERPRCRGDCVDGPRPCPFVGCRYHLFVDVTDAGNLKLNFPDLEVWELGQTCALDVADQGGVTLDDVGIYLNVSRERARQLELEALRLVREAAEPQRDDGSRTPER